MKKSNWLGIILSAVTIVFFLVWVPINAQRPSARVIVTNTAANPVPVSGCHKIPVDLVVQGSVAQGGANVATTYNVPEGKVLVIEYVNAYLDFYGVPSDMSWDLQRINAWTVHLENKDLPGETGTYWFPYETITRPFGWGENLVMVREHCSVPVSIRIAHQLSFGASYVRSTQTSQFNEGFQRMHVTGYLEDAQ